jgi:hypothetical protein
MFELSKCHKPAGLVCALPLHMVLSFATHTPNSRRLGAATGVHALAKFKTGGLMTPLHAFALYI